MSKKGEKLGEGMMRVAVAFGVIFFLFAVATAYMNPFGFSDRAMETAIGVVCVFEIVLFGTGAYIAIKNI